RLIDKGAGSIILACTEIPIGLHAIQSPILDVSFDTTQILADACVNWFYRNTQL
ncbi:aspartate/glutamate racemase family protein, partial [Acinetobacter baumannii]